MEKRRTRRNKTPKSPGLPKLPVVINLDNEDDQNQSPNSSIGGTDKPTLSQVPESKKRTLDRMEADSHSSSQHESPIGSANVSPNTSPNVTGEPQ